VTVSQFPVRYTRATLEALMDRYLEALVAHNPAGIPLANNIKFTENAQEIPVGEALWATASHLPTYKLNICDPVSGQVGFFGIMKENGFPIMLSARLKIEKELITEIETIVVRQVDGPWPIREMAQPRSTLLEPIEKSSRVPREEMIKIADLYFEGLVRCRGDIIPFDDACNRIENGLQTSNNPGALPNSTTNLFAMNCRDQMNSKLFSYINEVNPRRYTVIDEERGLVLGTFLFHHSGVMRSGEKSLSGGRPFTTLINELFKIQDRKIRDIEVIMKGLPYRSGSGWDE
jgi:hypothetical protein